MKRGKSLKGTKYCEHYQWLTTYFTACLNNSMRILDRWISKSHSHKIVIYVIDISNCLLFRPKSWHYNMLSLSQEVNIHLLLRVSNNLSFHICWIILAALIYESWFEFKFKTGTVCNACSWHKNRFTWFRHVTEWFLKNQN